MSKLNPEGAHLCLRANSVLPGLALALALSTFTPKAYANVYASNVKINGGTTNLSVLQGTNVTISYILNEPASAGITIKILSGQTAVRTISVPGGGAGAARGTNAVAWDGKDNSNRNVPGGNYTVSITAAATGYAGWTRITDDDNPGNYTWEARGIAVDRNTNSPYYGRVFVGNSYPGPGSSLGDRVGIQKLNADGSYADEGGFSDGGIVWPASYLAPWRIRVSEDDQVYVQDYYAAGDIYRFDGAISSNSMLHVFAPPADLTLGSWSGFRITGRGSDTVLWGSDYNLIGSVGISKFFVKPDGTFDATAGTNVVAMGGFPGLNDSPFAVDVDRAGAIYTLQYRDDQGDTSAQVFRFPAYDPATNGGQPELTADWVAGPGTNADYCGAWGLAVDPTGTYLAAAFWGYFVPPGGPHTNGNLKILNAATGTLVTNLDLGIGYTNKWTDDPVHHEDTEADWDAVGNVYYLDDWGICWRAFSPPGPNQATTVALPVVTVIPIEVPIRITSIGISNRLATIRFTASSSDPAWAFLLLSSSTVGGTYSTVANANITGSDGNFQATTPISGARQFYRIMRPAVIPLRITSLTVAGGTNTIIFTGSVEDSPSAFTLLSANTVSGGYSAAPSATITQLSPGRFQATTPVIPPRQFFRIRK
jgi:hypothetical protein